MTATQIGRVASLFTTPILTENWTAAAVNNEALTSTILGRRNKDPGVARSNVLGWQSDAAMAEWGGEAARHLLDHVRAQCDAITVDLREENARRFRWETNMWSNVSSRGASNQTHSHPGSYWSAVYYVDDGYAGSADRVLGGELVFLDPRMPMVRMGTPDLRYRRPSGERDHQETWMRPESGRLVIFPSWLMHSVRPYQGAGIRISIAINLAAWPASTTPRK